MSDNSNMENDNANKNNLYNNNNNRKQKSTNIHASVEKEAQNSTSPVKYVSPVAMKIDYSEREEENCMIVYVFVKNISKESLQLQFSEKNVTLRFKTTDAKFLELNSSSDIAPCSKDTYFEHVIPLVGAINTDKCSYSLSFSKIELKLKKSDNLKWNAVSPVTDVSPSSKRTWSSASSEKARVIPPAPPTPPTPVQNRKPTCLVSPSSYSRTSSISNSFMGSYGGSSNNYGGYMGLDNIGNTCFMNSVLQTLINTRELRDYFCNDPTLFQNDLNKNNPLGQGGRLAVAFAVLMKTAWSSANRSFAPSKLKSVMSMKANQFSGFAQHDAQEFMVELLDGLHEDLNRIKKKPYCAEPPDLDGWDDVDAALEAWKLHKLRNDSIIDDLFKGQFRSALRCHECHKISVKFDEFCCLSVPIPKDQKVLEVIFFHKSSSDAPTKLRVRISADALTDDLKREIGSLVSVPASNIQIIDVYKHKLQKIFQQGAPIGNVTSNDMLLAFEVMTPNQIGGQEVVELCVVQRLSSPTRPLECATCGRKGNENTRIQRCTKCLAVGYCSTECQKNNWSVHAAHCRLLHEFVGSPFIISLPKSHATYSTLARTMEAYARHSVDIFQPPVSNTQTSGGNLVPRIRKGSTSSNEMSPDEDQMDVDTSVNSEDNAEDDSNGFSSRPDTVNNDWGTGGRVLGAAPKKTIPGTTICPVPPLLPTSSAATKLFNIMPVSSRGLNLPQHSYFTDLGNYPIPLSSYLY